jgi:hypothetical protein
VFGPVLGGSLIFQIAADSGYSKKPSKKLWFHERTRVSLLVLPFTKNNSGWELGGSFSKNQRNTSPSYFKNPKKIIFSENQAG